MKRFGALLIAGTATVTLLACKACRPQPGFSPDHPLTLATSRQQRSEPVGAVLQPAGLGNVAVASESAAESVLATSAVASVAAESVVEIDVRPGPVASITPGTVVDRGPPRGWSHLVVKSLPRVAESHRKQVNALTARMAEWMFTAFVADVGKTAEGQYELRSLALGLGTNVQGQDLVLTSESARQFGADLGLFGGRILDTAYERQTADSRMMARSPQMAIVDTPVWFHRDGVNRLIRFRYALLVDADTGRLDVMVWVVDPQGKKWGESLGFIQVKESAVYAVDLIPDWNQFTLGIPSEGGFGVAQLPPGRRLPEIPPAFADAARRGRFTSESAKFLEGELRTLLAAVPSTPASTK